MSGGAAMDFGYANRRRDRRLRKLVLLALHASRGETPTGQLPARRVVDLVDSVARGSQRFESDRHALQLIADLEAKAYLAKEVRGLRRDEAFGLDHLWLKVTATGVSLVEQSIAPDPDVDDDRNLED